MTAQFAPGIVLPLHPFFGSMGVAPAPADGRVRSNPPGRHAGNLDNRELVAGSTLLIDFVAAQHGLSRREAYQLVSLAGNVAITQLVDKPNYGVHVRIPKSIFGAK